MLDDVVRQRVCQEYDDLIDVWGDPQYILKEADLSQLHHLDLENVACRIEMIPPPSV